MARKKADYNADSEDTMLKERRRAFGENMRRERVTRGFKTQDVANYLHVTPGYVGLMERGQRFPLLELFFEICDLFGVTPNELLTERRARRGLKVAEPETPYVVSGSARLETIQAMLSDMDERELSFIEQTIKSLKDMRED